MKRILLGTTTLISAAALYANAALADTPKITVGGFADFQVGIANDDADANQRSQSMRSDTEVSFKVDAKSDAGLGYGGEIWLEADTTDDADSQGDNASKTFVYLDGIWGRLELGSNVGADATMKVDAAGIARATGGIDGDWSYFANNRGSVYYLATPDLPLNYGFVTGGYGDESQENTNKVTYYTPRWSGFQLGVSYSANDAERGQTIVRSDARGTVTPSAGSASTTFSRAENIFTGGVNWEGKYDQIGLAVGATGEIGDAETATYEDLQAWNAGGKVSYMGFSVAGSYGSWGESLRLSSINADETRYWTAGGAFEHGPFGVSVTYLNSRLDNGSAAADDKFRNWSVGADYKLAPGLTPYVEASFYEADAPGTASDNDGSVVLVGTQLNF